MNYLLFLQSIRENAPAFINYFFVLISEGLLSGLILIPAVIYWSVDKQIGSWMLFNYSGAYLFNQFLKNTACVYRPWIREPRLHIANEAAKSATGYSFPSGHTTLATAVLESTAVWQRKRKWCVALCSVFILLVAFARNWLGAHTPTDVITAVCVTSCIIILNIFITRFVQNNDSKDYIFAIVGIVIAVALIFYFEFKKYPMDYDLEGNLLVDPYKMITDCYTGCGMFIGFLLGWLLERRFIKFRMDVSVKRKVVRGVICALVLGLLYLVILPLATKPMGAHIGHLVKYFFIMFYITFIAPVFIKIAERKCN